MGESEEAVGHSGEDRMGKKRVRREGGWEMAFREH